MSRKKVRLEAVFIIAKLEADYVVESKDGLDSPSNTLGRQISHPGDKKGRLDKSS